MVKTAKIALLSLCFLSIAFNCFASNWENRAKQAFILDEYEKCIAIVNSGKGDSLNRPLFLAFSNLQLFQYTKAKDYRTAYQTHLKNAEANAQISSLSDILFFVNLSDKPEVVKATRNLTWKILKGMYKIEDVPLLIPFAESTDQQMRTLSYDAIRKIFKTKREVVNKGGNLRAQDMQIMSNPKLIKILLDNASDRSAADVLVLIEEPVLKHAEKISDLHVARVQEKISGAITKRRKAYPNSNWASATGQER